MGASDRYGEKYVGGRCDSRRNGSDYVQSSRHAPWTTSTTPTTSRAGVGVGVQHEIQRERTGLDSRLDGTRANRLDLLNGPLESTN